MKHAKCKKCGKVMPKVREGGADYCYDCVERFFDELQRLKAMNNES